LASIDAINELTVTKASTHHTNTRIRKHPLTCLKFETALAVKRRLQCVLPE